MNPIQITILIIALAVSALILWHDLPIGFPWMVNMVMLFVKLSIVAALAIVVFLFAGSKKKSAKKSA